MCFYGQADGLTFYAFPTLDQLSMATEEELRAAGFGYRCLSLSRSFLGCSLLYPSSCTNVVVPSKIVARVCLLGDSLISFGEGKRVMTRKDRHRNGSEDDTILITQSFSQVVTKQKHSHRNGM